MATAVAVEGDAPASATAGPPPPTTEEAAHDAREETTTSRKDGGELPELEELGDSAHQRSRLERPHETNGAAWEGAGEEEATVLEREGGEVAIWVADRFRMNSGGGLVEGSETVGEGEEGSGVVITY